ncbi:antitoxin MazE [Fontibacillus panacisegetis]|uniref:Antitoxin MazE n=1 Tax=Fontibacillus panacisegetis TaxID=670482 RepID=A0A1G7T498_9BACL|nr:AbrB/MazE/SpoVT family DNA-binding domain-containing protein [Fontibacillus panacisegetis]SDG29844.1 antitoxin MazE [Fontibacillus panacisegetis]
MTSATIKKWGNSLALRLPLEVANYVNFKEGSEVEILVSDNNEIILRPLFPAADDQDALRAHFLALRSKCKPGMLKHEEMFHEPMGDESI